jgi:SAM-dependent methyltransferase
LGTGDFDLSEVYDHLIDWPTRLAREEKFFRPLFERFGVRSVLDTACGTGQHGAMFHSWGLRVEGADIDPVMIEKARASFGEPDGLTWRVRGFGEPVAAKGSFDAALCVGNSLSIAEDPAAAAAAVAAMLGSVKEGGVVLVQLLNHWRLKEGPSTWQKCMRVVTAAGEAIIVKGMHRSGSRVFLELIVLPLSEDCELKTTSIPLLSLEAAQVESMAREGGASSVELYGGYQGQPYEKDSSVDLVMIARK